MKNNIAILMFIIWSSICSAASQSYVAPESLEGTVYGLHDPNCTIKLVRQSALNVKKLKLQMLHEEFASNRIELDGNAMAIDGKPLPAPLSLMVAGGYPKQENHLSSANTTYFPAQRFFVLQKYIGFWHTEDPNKELQKNVQAFNSLGAVMAYLSKTSIPSLVIDLNAWLDVAYGESRKDLPVIRVPRQHPWLYSDHSDHGFEDLTQEQYEYRLTKKESDSIESMIALLHIN